MNDAIVSITMICLQLRRLSLPNQILVDMNSLSTQYSRTAIRPHSSSYFNDVNTPGVNRLTKYANPVFSERYFCLKHRANQVMIKSKPGARCYLSVPTHFINVLVDTPNCNWLVQVHHTNPGVRNAWWI